MRGAQLSKLLRDGHGVPRWKSRRASLKEREAQGAKDDPPRLDAGAF